MEKHKPDAGIEPGYFWIEIRPDGIIFVEPTGYITGDVVKRDLEKLKLVVAQVQRDGHPVRILVNIGKITKHTSESRSEIKKAADLGFDRGAAYGGSRALGLVMQYLQRSIDPTRAHYFRTENDALTYLKAGPSHKRPGFRAASRRSIIISSVLLVLFIVLTYLSWSYSSQQLTRESQALFGQQVQRSKSELQRRMDVYIQALYGFRGLFNASHSVERNEFETYFKSLDLLTEFPGFNAISFVKQVPRADLASYQAAVRADTSINAAGYPKFKVYPASNKATYDIVTYAEPVSPTTNFGFDLSSDPVRLQTLNTARDSGLPTATGTISFASDPTAKGFLVAMPIYSKPAPTTKIERQHQLLGYVNAVFRYKTLFNDAFSDISEPNVTIAIRDDQGQLLYSAGKSQPGGQAIARNVQIAGQTLTVNFKAPQSYGLSETSLRLPRNAVSGGVLAIVLLALLLVTLLRSRSQATRLAETMTVDLENERNLAVQNEHKLELSEQALTEAKASVERKVIERTRELNETHAQLEASLRGLPFGFVIINGDHVGVFSNEALETIVGRNIPTGNAGKTTIQQLNEGLAGALDVSACLHDAESSRALISRECMLGTKYLHVLFIPILERQGNAQEVAGSVIILEDVTEEKALQRSRDEFFSIASHELRTPLTAMYGNATMILDTYQEQLDDPALKQMVIDIAASSKRLIAIVKDFLNVSELEQGKASVVKASVDIHTITSEVAEQFKTDADHQKLYLKAIEPKAKITVNTDAERVRQILENLVRNSLHFTRTGGITLDITKDDHVARVAVSDTGIGIPIEYQHLLFRKFQQAGASLLTRESSQSTGLGLYISKLMAELMGGKLYLEKTEVNKGSTFILELPLDRK